MLKNIAIINIIIIFIVLTTACSTLDPGIYGEKRQAIIEQQFVVQEKAKTAQQNEQMLRERGQARNVIAMTEITRDNNSNNLSATHTPIIGQNGVRGGFPVIFINDARYGRTIMLQKKDGLNAGYKWSLSIPAGRFREYSLETGVYQIFWTIDGDYNQRQTGPEEFAVTATAHFYYDNTQKQYCGGYRFFGR